MLFSNYNKLERPVMNEAEAVVLSFGLTLQQIIDVVSHFQSWNLSLLHFYLKCNFFCNFQV